MSNKLLDNLLRYGRHDESCPTCHDTSLTTPKPICNCGLHEAIDALKTHQPVSGEVECLSECLKYAVADLKGLLGLMRGRLESYHISSVEGTIHDANEALARIGAKHAK